MITHRIRHYTKGEVAWTRVSKRFRLFGFITIWYDPFGEYEMRPSGLEEAAAWVQQDKCETVVIEKLM